MLCKCNVWTDEKTMLNYEAKRKSEVEDQAPVKNKTEIASHQFSKCFIKSISDLSIWKYHVPITVLVKS